MKNVLLGMLLTLATFNAVAVGAVESTKTGLYVGIGSTGTAVDTPLGDVSVASLSIKLGFDFTPNVAVEFRYIGESNGDKAGGLEFVVDSTTALYTRISLGNETFDPYILLGYAKVEGTVSGCNNGCMKATTSDSGFAAGLGANWKITDTFSITGDWTVPAEDTVQFNLGFDYKF